MTRARILVFTAIAMIAFAGNSILCRLALRDTRIDAVTFTSIRLISGALALWLIVSVRGGQGRRGGTWVSAIALFTYAITFSLAYISLTAGTGALILFGAVHLTMVGSGVFHGERLGARQVMGVVTAFAGLVVLLMPGLSRPPIAGAGLMFGAGVAWAVYSLRGRGSGDPTAATAGNFARSLPFALAASVLMAPWTTWDARGAAFAVASGALTSGLGYAVWYTALGGLERTAAATVQLSVPVIAALGGVGFLAEPMTWRLAIASIGVLGGIAIVIGGSNEKH